MQKGQKKTIFTFCIFFAKKRRIYPTTSSNTRYNYNDNDNDYDDKLNKNKNNLL